MLSSSTTDPGVDAKSAAPIQTELNQHTRVAANSGLLSVAAAVVGVLSYGCTLLMANMLNPGDYSQFAAAQMLLGIVGIVASALVPLPLSHIVASNASGTLKRRQGIAFALLVSVLAGTAAALATGAVTLALAGPGLASGVALAALVLFVVAAPCGWLQGELRFVWYAATAVGEVAARLLLSFAVVAFAWGASGAILGFVVGALVLLVVPLAFYRDVTWSPQVLRHKWRWAETGDIALTLCVVSILVGADVVVVAFLDGGSAAAAGFQALATIAKGPVYVAAGTVLVVFPLLRTPGVSHHDVLGAALRSFGQLAGVAFVVIATAPQALVALILPERYHGSLGLMPWLALAGIGYATLTVLATVLLAVKAYRRCKWGLLCASVLVLGGLVMGWQWGGVDGLAIGCAVGSALAAAVLGLITSPLLPPGTGFAALRGLLLITCLVLVLAVASMWPVLWMVLVAGLGVLVILLQRGEAAASKFAAYLGFLSSVPTAIFGVMEVWTIRAPAAARKIGSRLLLPASSLTPSARSGVRLPLLGPAAPAAPPEELSAEELSEHGRRRAWPKWKYSTFASFLAIFGVAFGVRAIGLSRGFELWVDEMLYASLGLSVSAGQIPNLPDGPFFLHPPGFFLVEGGVANLLGITGTAVEVVMQLRWLNALFGAVTVALAFLLVRMAGNATVAWAAAAVLMFDPFVLRNNSHLFLESLGMAVVIAGLLIVVAEIQRRSGSPRVLPLAAAGLLMGYGILTKDIFAICTFGPVVIATAWRRTLRVRDSLVLVTGMVLPYLAYLVTISILGLLPDWVFAKTSGAQRMIGVEKSTGFSAEGSPDLATRLLDQLMHFGTSYLLLALCPVAAALVCFSARPERRLVGLMALSLGTFGVYSAAFGTFEEQYGYGVIIASVLAVAVLAAELTEKRPKFGRAAMVIGVGFVGCTIMLGLRAEATIDNGYAQVGQWVRDELPTDAKVSVTNSTGELAFADDSRFGVWPSAPLMQENDVRYILTQSLPTSQGYGYAQPQMLTWLAGTATPLFRVEGPTNGATTLWVVDSAELEKAAIDGVGEPSKTYETER